MNSFDQRQLERNNAKLYSAISDIYARPTTRIDMNADGRLDEYKHQRDVIRRQGTRPQWNDERRVHAQNERIYHQLQSIYTAKQPLPGASLSTFTGNTGTLGDRRQVLSRPSTSPRRSPSPSGAIHNRQQPLRRTSPPPVFTAVPQHPLAQYAPRSRPATAHRQTSSQRPTSAVPTFTQRPISVQMSRSAHSSESHLLSPEARTDLNYVPPRVVAQPLKAREKQKKLMAANVRIEERLAHTTGHYGNTVADARARPLLREICPELAPRVIPDAAMGPAPVRGAHHVYGALVRDHSTHSTSINSQSNSRAGEKREDNAATTVRQPSHRGHVCERRPFSQPTFPDQAFPDGTASDIASQSSPRDVARGADDDHIRAISANHVIHNANRGRGQCVVTPRPLDTARPLSALSRTRVLWAPSTSVDTYVWYSVDELRRGGRLGSSPARVGDRPSSSRERTESGQLEARGRGDRRPGYSQERGENHGCLGNSRERVAVHAGGGGAAAASAGTGTGTAEDAYVAGGGHSAEDRNGVFRERTGDNGVSHASRHSAGAPPGRLHRRMLRERMLVEQRETAAAEAAAARRRAGGLNEDEYKEAEKTEGWASGNEYMGGEFDEACDGYGDGYDHESAADVYARATGEDARGYSQYINGGDSGDNGNGSGGGDDTGAYEDDAYYTEDGPGYDEPFYLGSDHDEDECGQDYGSGHADAESNRVPARKASVHCGTGSGGGAAAAATPTIAGDGVIVGAPRRGSSGEHVVAGVPRGNGVLSPAINVTTGSRSNSRCNSRTNSRSDLVSTTTTSSSSTTAVSGPLGIGAWQMDVMLEASALGYNFHHEMRKDKGGMAAFARQHALSPRAKKVRTAVIPRYMRPTGTVRGERRGGSGGKDGREEAQGERETSDGKKDLRGAEKEVQRSKERSDAGAEELGGGADRHRGSTIATATTSTSSPVAASGSTTTLESLPLPSVASEAAPPTTTGGLGPSQPASRAHTRTRPYSALPLTHTHSSAQSHAHSRARMHAHADAAGGPLPVSAEEFSGSRSTFPRAQRPATASTLRGGLRDIKMRRNLPIPGNHAPRAHTQHERAESQRMHYHPDGYVGKNPIPEKPEGNSGSENLPIIPTLPLQTFTSTPGPLSPYLQPQQHHALTPYHHDTYRGHLLMGPRALARTHATVAVNSGTPEPATVSADTSASIGSADGAITGTGTSVGTSPPNGEVRMSAPAPARPRSAVVPPLQAHSPMNLRSPGHGRSPARGSLGRPTSAHPVPRHSGHRSHKDAHAHAHQHTHGGAEAAVASAGAGVSIALSPRGDAPVANTYSHSFTTPPPPRPVSASLHRYYVHSFSTDAAHRRWTYDTDLSIAAAAEQREAHVRAELLRAARMRRERMQRKEGRGAGECAADGTHTRPSTAGLRPATAGTRPDTAGTAVSDDFGSGSAATIANTNGNSTVKANSVDPDVDANAKKEPKAASRVLRDMAARRCPVIPPMKRIVATSDDLAKLILM